MLKILMLEDNPDDVLLIEHILRKENISFVNQCVDTRREYTEAIERFRPDVVLSDHGLPGFNSREAFKISVKQNPAAPFILVTGTVSDDYAISCLREGVDDYILKSNLSRLPTAILGALKRRRLEKLKREARHALRKQNEELLKVNKELDNFVYSVSHNLRGPLASVLGLLQLVQNERDAKNMDTLHAMMETSINKLDGTLQEILEFSRNARSEIKSEEIHWQELIDISLGKLEYLDKDNHVDRFVTVQSEEPFYQDSNRLGIVLTSLLSNAFQFRDARRKPFVSVKVTTSAQQAIVIIRDNGIGIHESILPKIYTMFYRGSEESRGAGLGLYIVKEVLARLNGTIDVASVAGQGTTVTITLPSLGKRE
jgi:hypothetical protein